MSVNRVTLKDGELVYSEFGEYVPYSEYAKLKSQNEKLVSDAAWQAEWNRAQDESNDRENW